MRGHEAAVSVALMTKTCQRAIGRRSRRSCSRVIGGTFTLKTLPGYLTPIRHETWIVPQQRSITALLQRAELPEWQLHDSAVTTLSHAPPRVPDVV